MGHVWGASLFFALLAGLFLKMGFPGHAAVGLLIAGTLAIFAALTAIRDNRSPF